MFFNRVSVLFYLAGITYALPVHDKSGALWYLLKFGHLEKSDPGPEYETVSSAITDFQKTAGLTETGKLNSETIARMNIPRCHLENTIGHDEMEMEMEHILEENERPATGLTYSIKKYPIRAKDVTSIRRELAQAFKVWSDVVGLYFKKEAIGHVDIGISFDLTDPANEKSSGHTLFPRYHGSANFDKKEIHKTDEKMGTQFVEIAEENFGSSLDLMHASKLWDLMEPFYKGYEDKKVKEPIVSPDICKDASLDTITRTHDGSTYAFKGDFYWKINYNVTADGYPRRIADDWDGLEGNLDASFTTLDGKTFFFKGGRCWSFTNKKLDSGYPKLISDRFRGIPDHLDAALTWGQNGKPYFFKGGQYWRYDAGEYPPVKDGYPSPISAWKGLPLNGIDAAFLWDNNASYFFKGGYYYRFDDATSEVSKQYNYPASTATEWFSCVRRN